MTAVDSRTAYSGAPLFVHRNNTGRSYRGLPIHAAPGVHEFVAAWLDMNRPHDAPVLEVGADTGALTARLMDRDFEVVPVDMESAPFTRCCPNFLEVDFNAPNWMADLPEPAFETIVAVGIIEHLENPKKLIRDLYVACARGGEVIVSTANVLNASSLLRFIREGGFHGLNPASRKAQGALSILPYWLIETYARDVGFVETEVMFIGDMERPWLTKTALKAADGILRRIRGETAPSSAFGNVVFMRLVKGTE